jgi:peptidoglycan hydrolase-like protein with peptidoglycan-binding domain
MESLAFLHSAIAHEDPAPELRPELQWDVVLERVLEAMHRLLGQVTLLRGGVALTVLGLVLGQLTTVQTLAQAALQRGDRGEAVAKLQKELRIEADGVFGPQTQEYLTAYQRLSGLQPTGVADAQTLAAMGLPASAASGAGFGAASGASSGAASGSVSGTAQVQPRTPQPVAAAPANEPAYESPRPAAAPPESAGAGEVAVARAVAGRATVTAQSGLNVRDMPAGAVINHLAYNQGVQLTGDRRAAGRRHWVQLASGGWVAEDFLTMGGAAGDSAGGSVGGASGAEASGAEASGAEASGGNGGGSPSAAPSGEKSVAPAKSSPAAGRVSARTGLIVRNAPGGAAIGSLGNGQTVKMQGDRQLANGRYWVKLASGGWVAEEYVVPN